ncbi:unnamed protein product [Amoebophrya sp. A120]|nr:unnamed protein product [Amoebophrya sp. A120]|eukprot:GSA120T00008881001.1
MEAEVEVRPEELRVAAGDATAGDAAAGDAAAGDAAAGDAAVGDATAGDAAAGGGAAEEASSAGQERLQQDGNSTTRAAAGAGAPISCARKSKFTRVAERIAGAAASLQQLLINYVQVVRGQKFAGQDQGQGHDQQQHSEDDGDVTRSQHDEKQEQLVKYRHALHPVLNFLHTMSAEAMVSVGLHLGATLQPEFGEELLLAFAEITRDLCRKVKSPEMRNALLHRAAAALELAAKNSKGHKSSFNLQILKDIEQNQPVNIKFLHDKPAGKTQTGDELVVEDEGGAAVEQQQLHIGNEDNTASTSSTQVVAKEDQHQETSSGNDGLLPPGDSSSETAGARPSTSSTQDELHQDENGDAVVLPDEEEDEEGEDETVHLPVPDDVDAELVSSGTDAVLDQELHPTATTTHIVTTTRDEHRYGAACTVLRRKVEKLLFVSFVLIFAWESGRRDPASVCASPLSEDLISVSNGTHCSRPGRPTCSAGQAPRSLLAGRHSADPLAEANAASLLSSWFSTSNTAPAAQEKTVAQEQQPESEDEKQDHNDQCLPSIFDVIDVPQGSEEVMCFAAETSTSGVVDTSSCAGDESSGTSSCKVVVTKMGPPKTCGNLRGHLQVADKTEGSHNQALDDDIAIGHETEDGGRAPAPAVPGLDDRRSQSIGKGAALIAGGGALYLTYGNNMR